MFSLVAEYFATTNSFCIHIFVSVVQLQREIVSVFLFFILQFMEYNTSCYYIFHSGKKNSKRFSKISDISVNANELLCFDSSMSFLLLQILLQVTLSIIVKTKKNCFTFQICSEYVCQYFTSYCHLFTHVRVSVYLPMYMVRDVISKFTLWDS